MTDFQSSPGASDAQARRALSIVDLDSFKEINEIDLRVIEGVLPSEVRVSARTCFTLGLDDDRSHLIEEMQGFGYRVEKCADRDVLKMRLVQEIYRHRNEGQADCLLAVSGDPAFRHLANIATEVGYLLTIGVGPRAKEATDEKLIRGFDSFMFYPQLREPLKDTELEKIRMKYAEALLKVVYYHEQRGLKAVGSSVIPALRYEHPEFSPQLVGYTRWIDLAEFAVEKQLLEPLEASGQDRLLKVKKGSEERAKQLLTINKQESDAAKELEQARQAIHDAIGCDLPDPKTRYLIFSTLGWVLTEELPSAGVHLVNLSYQILERIPEGTIDDRNPQNVVYRLINGAYRAFAFDIKQNIENENDPVILRLRLPTPQLDTAFLFNLVRILRKRAPLALGSKRLAELLYNDVKKQTRVDLLLKESSESHIRPEAFSATLTRIEQQR